MRHEYLLGMVALPDRGTPSNDYDVGFLQHDACDGTQLDQTTTLFLRHMELRLRAGGMVQ